MDGDEEKYINTKLAMDAALAEFVAAAREIGKDPSDIASDIVDSVYEVTAHNILLTYE